MESLKVILLVNVEETNDIVKEYIAMIKKEDKDAQIALSINKNYQFLPTIPEYIESIKSGIIIKLDEKLVIKISRLGKPEKFIVGVLEDFSSENLYLKYRKKRIKFDNRKVFIEVF